MLISSCNSRQKDVLCETGLWESWEFLAVYVDSKLFFLYQEFSNSGFTKKWYISFKVILLLFYQRCFKIKWEFPKKIVTFDWCLIFGTTSQKKNPFFFRCRPLRSNDNFPKWLVKTKRCCILGLNGNFSKWLVKTKRCCILGLKDNFSKWLVTTKRCWLGAQVGGGRVESKMCKITIHHFIIIVKDIKKCIPTILMLVIVLISLFS